MPWFWRSRRDEDDDDDDGSYESYTDEDDDDEPHEMSEESVDESSSSENNSDSNEEEKDNDATREIERDRDKKGTSFPLPVVAESSERTNNSGGIRTKELEELQLVSFGTATATTSDRTTDHINRVVALKDEANTTEEDDESEEEVDSWLRKVPAIIGTSRLRERVPSAISVDDEDGYDENNNNNVEENDKKHDSEKEVVPKPTNNIDNAIAVADAEICNGEQSNGDDDEVTSMHDKQSLLVLAAEHDRVDILQAILSGNNDTTSSENNERGLLLNPVAVIEGTSNCSKDEIATSAGTSRPVTVLVTTVPPLHIAVSYGSVNAVNCLLRMGADPSLRPDVAAILQAAQDHSKDEVEMVPRIHRFDGMTAWELAFAESSTSSPTKWSIFRGGSSESLDNSQRSTANNSRRSNNKNGPVDMAPSKREGIRHAFTAEALRCIGSDEVERLQQLLNAGMPAKTEIGGKSLSDWCVDMGAVHCQAVLASSGAPSATEGNDDNEPQLLENAVNGKKSAVLDRGGNAESSSSIPALTNRLDELESLSKALSTCLDNLAEEVSVCSGLLLVGGGAQALASHVRSLKAKKDRKYDELERVHEAWENSEDELAYWVKQCPDKAEDVLLEVSMISSERPTASNNDTAKLQTSGSPTKEAVGDGVNDEASQQRHRQQLRAQIGAIEHKIRMLRASIADLSEENARNLAEVDRRGLSGGITLVRGLRDEIREIEYQLSDVKSGEAACRAKIRLIQVKAIKLTTAKTNGGHPKTGVVEGSKKPELQPTTSTNGGKLETERDIASYEEEDLVVAITESERIATGQSTAIVVRQNNGTRGFLPFNLWEILLRIIGLSDNNGRGGQGDARHIMIV